jgi:hypothetical protein
MTRYRAAKLIFLTDHKKKKKLKKKIKFFKKFYLIFNN